MFGSKRVVFFVFLHFVRNQAMSVSQDSRIVPASFNGGKMIHIFSFDDETHLYAPTFESAASKEALEKGNLFYKIDGSNGLVKKKKGNDGLVLLEAFQRLDTKGRPSPEGCIPLPPGSNMDSYQGHSYYYEPITTNVDGKKARKRNEDMLKVVQDHAHHMFPKVGNEEEEESAASMFVSMEWVGYKFNKTPGVPHNVGIAIHSEQACKEVVERTFEGMKSFLLESNPPIEGLIVEYDGLYYKVRGDGFDKKCRFRTNPSSARPPIFLVSPPTTTTTTSS
jgi:hypothetical protein